MSKIRVLLLISRNIDLKMLNHSPRFQRYHFFALPAIDYLGNPASNPASRMLRIALERKIERVHAQYLLAHLGLAFDRYPVEFLTAVLDIQALHPRLKIGLDKGLEYAIQHLKLFAAPDPEVTRLLGRLVQNPSVFDMDGETATLAGCLC
jgi:hypothetical protein